MTNVTYQLEKLEDILEDILPMLESHWYEVEDIPFDPNLDAYLQLDALGMYRMVTARVDGFIDGYVGAIIAPRLQCKSIVVATAELFYVSPELRATRIARDLLLEAEKAFKELGASEILLSFKSRDNYEKFGRKRGYTHTASVLSKNLGG